MKESLEAILCQRCDQAAEVGMPGMCKRCWTLEVSLIGYLEHAKAREYLWNALIAEFCFQGVGELRLRLAAAEQLAASLREGLALHPDEIACHLPRGVFAGTAAFQELITTLTMVQPMRFFPETRLGAIRYEIGGKRYLLRKDRDDRVVGGGPVFVYQGDGRGSSTEISGYMIELVRLAQLKESRGVTPGEVFRTMSEFGISDDWLQMANILAANFE